MGGGHYIFPLSRNYKIEGPFRPPPLIDGPNDPVHYVQVATHFCGLRSERLPQKSNNYVLAKMGSGPGGGGGGGWVENIKNDKKTYK